MTITDTDAGTGTNAKLILILRILLGAVIIGLLGFSFIIGYESGAKNETAQAQGISFSQSDGSQWICFRPATDNIRAAYKGLASVYDPNSEQVCFRTVYGNTDGGRALWDGPVGTTAGSQGSFGSFTSGGSGGTLNGVEIGTAISGSAGGVSVN